MPKKAIFAFIFCFLIFLYSHANAGRLNFEQTGSRYVENIAGYNEQFKGTENNESKSIHAENLKSLQSDLKEGVVLDLVKWAFGGIALLLIIGFIRFIFYVIRLFGKFDKKANKKDNDILAPVNSDRRLINLIIDAFLFINVIYSIIAYAMIDFGLYSEKPEYILLQFFLLSITVYSSYYLFFEGIWGRTPGKFFTKTRVISKYGTNINAIQLLKRTATRLIPFEAFSFLGSNVSGWHDKWSDTVVVKSNYDSGSENVKNISDNKEKENNNTLQEFKDKKWYRFLEVLYFSVFIIIFVFTLFYNYDNNDHIKYFNTWSFIIESIFGFLIIFFILELLKGSFYYTLTGKFFIDKK